VQPVARQVSKDQAKYQCPPGILLKIEKPVLVYPGEDQKWNRL
jgi:hypothetical protein